MSSDQQLTPQLQEAISQAVQNVLQTMQPQQGTVPVQQLPPPRLHGFANSSVLQQTPPPRQQGPPNFQVLQQTPSPRPQGLAHFPVSQMAQMSSTSATSYSYMPQPSMSTWPRPSTSAWSRPSASFQLNRKKLAVKEKPFYRKIIVLNSPETTTLSAEERAMLEDNQLVREHRKFDKSWGCLEVKQKIYEYFSHIPIDGNIDIRIVKYDGKVIKPFLVDQTEMDGIFLHSNTKNAIYVQPSIKIINASDNDESEEDDEPEVKKPAPNLVVDQTNFFPEDFIKHWSAERIKSRISADRKNIGKSLFELSQTAHFSVLIELKVEFVGEGGTDLGALKMDFLRLLLNALKDDKSLFEGADYEKYLVLNIENLKSGKYKFIGQVLQIAMLNDMPYPEFFSDFLFEMIVDQNFTKNMAIDLEKVQNGAVQAALRQLQDAQDAAAANTIIREHNCLQCAGTKLCVEAASFEEDKRSIISGCFQFYMYEMLRGPLEQLREGLNQETDLVAHMRAYSQAYKQVFVKADSHQSLCAANIFSLFDAVASSPQEERALYNWQWFLHEVEDEKSSINFEEILIFSTANEKIPSLGYPQDKTPRISFIAGVNPTAAACFNHLRLPLDNITYDSFKENLETAFSKCLRFERA